MSARSPPHTKVGRLALDVRDHRLERGEVAVDVGDDG
jgi:hypothetical protein